LRDGLPQIGIGVLLFDRRGSGASTGKPNVAYQTLADDGIAGAQAVRRMPQIDPKRVGYWGISQGGWLATLAASHDPHAAFAIAVSAPLVSAESQMEFAMSNRLRVLGYGDADVRNMLEARKKLDGFYRGMYSRSDAVHALTAIENRPWFPLMYLPKPKSLPEDRLDSSWRGEMDLDSFADVERVRVPILFILGASDPWIPVAQTVVRLHEVAITHPLLTYCVVPNADHLMMTPPVHELMNDADPGAVALEMPQSAAYFMMLASWLERVTS
jgi:pimeloyl-ACP methyl ester carboxylesterase